MSISINNLQLSGRLGNDAKTHETADNKGWISFSLAVSDDKKRQDGTWEKRTIWVPVGWFTYGINHKAAHLTKGTDVLVSGRLRQEEWTKEGQKQTRLSVMANEVALIARNEAREARKPEAQERPSGAPLPESNPDDENMPF